MHQAWPVPSPLQFIQDAGDGMTPARKMGFIARKPATGRGQCPVQPRTRTHLHHHVFMAIKRLEALTDESVQAWAACKGINIDQVQYSHEYYPGPSSRLPSSDSM